MSTAAATIVTVTIGGIVRGTYFLQPSQSLRVSYAGLDSGPVVVKSSGGVKIIASIRDSWHDGTKWSSYAQIMGLPENLLSDTYLFPAYNNVSLDDQLRFGNVDTAATFVTVTIGGIVRGTYFLQPNQSMRVSYAGLDSGPVEVKSSGGVKIIASIRDAWHDGSKWTSYFQLMGLPKGQLSDTYLFPAYDNVTLDGQLRFGNVDTVPTTVTVTINGVVRGTYPPQSQPEPARQLSQPRQRSDRSQEFRRRQDHRFPARFLVRWHEMDQLCPIDGAPLHSVIHGLSLPRLQQCHLR